MHLRNAPTAAMKEWGYGEGYRHAHQFEGAITGMECLPSSLRGRTYYHPAARGVEQRIGERLAEIRRLREQRRTEEGSPSPGGEEPGPNDRGC
jgi:putative ATPase